MKWFYSVVSILMTPILLITMYGILFEHNIENLETLFWENEEEFRLVADELSDIYSQDDGFGRTYIVTEPLTTGTFIKQIDSLYFYAFDQPSFFCQPMQHYYDMYAAVEDIFSSLNLFSIVIDPNRIDFCTSSSYDVDCHIIYMRSGTPLDVEVNIKENSIITNDWYAAVSYNDNILRQRIKTGDGSLS